MQIKDQYFIYIKNTTHTSKKSKADNMFLLLLA